MSAPIGSDGKPIVPTKEEIERAREIAERLESQKFVIVC
jgi:hypothetical protein